MRISTIQQLHDILGGEYAGAAASLRRGIKGISTDTRSLKKGEAFLAIKGENFDGHNFLTEAVRKGASVGVVEHDWYLVNARKKLKMPLIVVRDTLDAYGRIALAHRRSFKIPIIAVAGSSGKTSTKEMISSVLEQKFNVLKTEKNFNNRIGVPATILKLTKRHDVAVVEIGTNMPGEIGALCRAIEPTHGVITNIGHEHLELLQSIDGVAEEEGTLFKWLTAHGGTGFVNLDDDIVKALGQGLANPVTYSRTKRGDYQVKVGRLNEGGAPGIQVLSHKRKSIKQVKAQLNTPGKHTAYNAAVAVAVGATLGVPATKIRKGLEEYRPDVDISQGYARLAMIRLEDGGRILNDTYNANPDSMRVALETLAGIKISKKGSRIAVLADMAELGTYASEEHRKVGELIAEMEKIDVAIFFGRQMRYAYEAIALADQPARVTSFFFRKKDKLIHVLNNLRTSKDIVLVKGSRSMKMEEVVEGVITEIIGHQ
ncbi:MAG: UDP-N-acetylmuramoyl-tripeptide--D-alanyl-D-alanine ligase [Chlorobi bacterium]|nr:UDP-N-acetylmuramoyl-tripeptide--D-alanyl-D-alanine ligase [Chlorobiota bacterium]